MASIVAVYAREILDSRGNPTIEVEVYLDDNSMVTYFWYRFIESISFSCCRRK